MTEFADTPALEPEAPLIAVLLHLSWLRAVVSVGTSLLEQYPTTETWEALLDDPDARRELSAFAAVLQDIRKRSVRGDPADLAALLELGEQRTEAMHALAAFAERVGVETDDLLAVLLSA